jgi:hypothetical protein
MAKAKYDKTREQEYKEALEAGDLETTKPEVRSFDGEPDEHGFVGVSADMKLPDRLVAPEDADEAKNDGKDDEDAAAAAKAEQDAKDAAAADEQAKADEAAAKDASK